MSLRSSSHHLSTILSSSQSSSRSSLFLKANKVEFIIIIKEKFHIKALNYFVILSMRKKVNLKKKIKEGRAKGFFSF